MPFILSKTGKDFVRHAAIIMFVVQLSLQLYASGLSLRRIGYLLQVSQVTIQKWIQKLVPELCPKLRPEGRVLVMELDEMWHYLQSKKTNSGSGKLCVVIPVDSLTGNLGIVIEKP